MRSSARMLVQHWPPRRHDDRLPITRKAPSATQTMLLCQDLSSRLKPSSDIIAKRIRPRHQGRKMDQQVQCNQTDPKHLHRSPQLADLFAQRINALVFHDLNSIHAARFMCIKFGAVILIPPGSYTRRIWHKDRTKGTTQVRDLRVVWWLAGRISYSSVFHIEPSQVFAKGSEAEMCATRSI